MPNSYLNNNGNVSQESTEQIKLTEVSKMSEEQFKLKDIFDNDAGVSEDKNKFFTGINGAALPLQQDLPTSIKKPGRRIGYVDDFETELIPNVPPLGTKLTVLSKLSNSRASAPLVIFEKHSFFDKISQVVNKRLLYATVAGLMVVGGAVGVYFWKLSAKDTNIIETATSDIEDIESTTKPDMVRPAAPSFSSSGRVSLHISQLGQGLNYTSGTSMPLAIVTATGTSNQ